MCVDEKPVALFSDAQPRKPMENPGEVTIRSTTSINVTAVSMFFARSNLKKACILTKSPKKDVESILQAFKAPFTN